MRRSSRNEADFYLSYNQNQKRQECGERLLVILLISWMFTLPQRWFFKATWMAKLLFVYNELLCYQNYLT